ncbi:MAG: c-type cytochrome [Acidobacteria bacterium]|nr:c-type cytochrome [Acidobacteriota bacterium]
MTHTCFKIGTLFFTGILVSLVIGRSAALGRNPDPRVGMKVFSEKGCVRCHPVLGEGGNIGPDLSRAPSTGDRFQLAAALWNHAPQMWQKMQQEHLELPTFELEEMEDLFAFLAMARSFDEPGNAQAGRQLFQSKQCGECHAIRGQGGRVGPDLTSVASYRNPVAWVAAMWNHASGMFRELSQKGVPFPQFQGTEMVDLQSYIRLMGGVDQQQPTYLRPPSADQGEILFQSKQCASCHSIGGRGGKIGPDLGRVVLPRRYGEIAVVMWNHAPQMNQLATAASVPYPRFEPQELADVLAYLNSLPATPRGNPTAGARTFEAKGCSGCHTTTPGAESIGPNLARLQQDLTPTSIAQTMWNHGPRMLQQMESSAIPWPVFNSQELADTVAFLESLHPPTRPTSTEGGQP